MSPAKLIVIRAVGCASVAGAEVVVDRPTGEVVTTALDGAPAPVPAGSGADEHALARPITDNAIARALRVGCGATGPTVPGRRGLLRHLTNRFRPIRRAPVTSAVVTNGPTFDAPIGTRDVLPPESARWEALIARFTAHAGRAGYGLVQSPMFEDIGVFRRVGEGTDVVTKEMYDFFDKGDRHLALRPEGTASIVRAFVQHRPVTPWKVFYAAPSFRYERPQAGRLRQHHQLGVEALGSDDPDLDVEVIALGWDHLASLGLQQVRLLINSMGTRSDRASYVATLRSWLDERRDTLDPADAAKVDDHPMRVLDSKRSATRAVVVDAPRITDSLSAEASDHFARVLGGLDALGIPYERTPTLVRGLDYYTHTTFEIVSDALDAAQSTILGGGRYDGLVAEMGGPDTPGIGFGSGIERVLLACDAEDVFPLDRHPIEVFVVDTTGGAEATLITTELRRAGIAADRAFDGRSMRAQMKVADRCGARIAAIVGPAEAADDMISVRDLRAAEGSEPQSRIRRADLTARLRAMLGPDDPAKDSA